MSTLQFRESSDRRAGKEGFDPERLEYARAVCREAVASGEIPGLSLTVARHGKVALSEGCGQVERAGTRPATRDTVWLTASVTKPIVCAGICLLLERGRLGLDDPASRYLPEFNEGERSQITLRHLLTHTSGLPDMLPENTELRKRHAPLAEFVRRIYTTPLLFRPGTRISYQSTGIALLGEIIARVTGQPCGEFLRREFFQPLGMAGTSLGWRPELAGRVAECLLPEGTEPSDWDWNSAYWRGFGAPWGGMFSTAPDLTRFLQMLLRGGEWEGRRYLGIATVRAMHRNQTREVAGLSSEAIASDGWGLGWKLASPGRSDFFGDLTSDSAYGHGGATGTAVWNDPESGVSLVLLTNRPGCGRFIGLVSNAVAAAVL